MRIQISVAAMLLSLSAVSQAAMFEPVPEPTIAPQDQAKVELGKMLWFDPRLSKSGQGCPNLVLFPATAAIIYLLEVLII